MHHQRNQVHQEFKFIKNSSEEKVSKKFVALRQGLWQRKMQWLLDKEEQIQLSVPFDVNFGSQRSKGLDQRRKDSTFSRPSER